MAAAAATRAGVAVDTPLLSWTELGMHLTVGATLASAKIFVILLLTGPIVLGAAGVAGGTYTVHLEYRSALETVANSTAMEDIVLGTGGVATGIANAILDSLSGIINGWNIVVPFVTFTWHLLYSAVRFFVVAIFANPQVQYFLVAWFQISVQLFETTVDATNAVIESMRDVVDALPLSVGEIEARGVGTPEAADGFLKLYDFLLALFVAFAELLIRVVQFLLQIFLPLLYVFIRAVLPALVSLVGPFLTLMSEVLNIITSPAVQRVLLIAVELLEMALSLTTFVCSFITIGGFVGCVTIATALTVFVFLWEKIVTPMLCIAASFAAGCFTSEDCQEFRTTDCPACSGKNSPAELASCRPQSIIQLDQGVDADALRAVQSTQDIRTSVYKRSAPAMCTAYCTPHTYFYGGQLFDRDADFNERSVAYNDYNNTILGWDNSIAYLGDFYGLTSRYPSLSTEDLSFNGTCPIEGLICAQTGWYCKKGASNETRWAFSPCLVNRCPYTSPWLTPAQQAVAMGDTGLSTPGFDITQVEAWDSVYGVDNDASCATAARTSALPEYFAPMRHCSDARHSVSTNGPCCLFPTSLYYTEAARECDPRVQLPPHCYGDPAPLGSPPCCLNADDNGYIDESHGPRLCRDGQQRGPAYHCSDSRYSPASHKGGCCLTDTEIFDGTSDFYPNRGGEIVCGLQDYKTPILECNDVAYTEPATPADAPLCCRYESDVLHDVSTAYGGWDDNPYVRRVSSVDRSNLQFRLKKNGDSDWIEWVNRESFSEVSNDAVKAAVASHLNQWTARIVGPRYFPDADVLPHCDALHSGAPTVRWMEYVDRATGEDRVRLLTARPKIVGVDNRGLPTPPVTSCSAFTTCCREHSTKSYTELHKSGANLPAEIDTRCGLGTYWSAFNGRRCVVDACNRANASLITYEAYPSGHQQCIPDPNVWSNAEIEYRALLYRPPLVFTTCRDDAVSNFASRSQRAAFHSIGVSHCESTTFDRDSPVVYRAFDAASRLGVRTNDSTSSLWAFQKGPHNLTTSASDDSAIDTFPEPLTLSPLIPTPRRDQRSRLTCCLGRRSDSMGEYGVPCSETLGSSLTAPPHCMQREGVYTKTAVKGIGATNASNATPTFLPGRAFQPELSGDSYWMLRVLQSSAKSTVLGCCWHAQETWGKNRVAPWQTWISHCVEQSQEEMRPFVNFISKCAAYDTADSSLARFAAPQFEFKLLSALRDIYERHYRLADEYDDPSFTALPGAPSETCWVFAPGGCLNNATTWWQDRPGFTYTYSSCKHRQSDVSAYCGDPGVTMHFVVPDPPNAPLYTCWVFAPKGCHNNATTWWKDEQYTQYTYSLCEARRSSIGAYCGDSGVTTHFVVPEPPQSPPGSCWVFAPEGCLENATDWWGDQHYTRYTYSSCKGRRSIIIDECGGGDLGIRTHFVHGTEEWNQEGAFDTMQRLKDSSQRVEERARADLRLWEVGANTFFMPCCRDPPRSAKEISELIGVGNFAEESVAQRLSVEDAHLFAAIHDSETAIMCRGSDAASETTTATTEAVAVTGACEPDVACFAGSSAYDAGHVLTPANARQCTPFPVSRPWSNQSMCCGLEEWQPRLRGPLPWHPINRGHLGALRCTAVERAVALRRTSLSRDNVHPQHRALGDIRKCSDVVNRTSGRTAEDEICCKRSAELCLAKPRSENAFPLVAGPVTPMTQRWRFCQYGCATMASNYQLVIDCLRLQTLALAGQSQNHNARRVAELPLEDSGCVRQRGGVLVGYRTKRMCLASQHENATTWIQCLPPSGDPVADLKREDGSGTGTCLTLSYPGASTWFFRPTDAEMNPDSPESAGESLRMLVRAWKLSTHSSFVDIPLAARHAISTRWQEHVLRSHGRGSAIRIGPLADEMVVPRELARMRVCDNVDRLRSDHVELARFSPIVGVAARLCDDLLPREREDAEGLLELREAGKDMHVRSAPYYAAVLKQRHEEAVETQFDALENRGPRRAAQTPCDDGDPSSARRSGSPCWTNMTYSNYNLDYFSERDVSNEQWYSLPWCAAWPQTNYGGCKAPRVAAWDGSGVFKVVESGDCARLDRPPTSTGSTCPGGRKCCRGKPTSELVYDIRAHEHAEQQLRITNEALAIGTYGADSWPTGSSWSFKETIRGGWAAIWDLGAQDELTVHMKIVSVPDGKRFYIGLLADGLSAEWGQAKPWAWLCHTASTGNARFISKISNGASNPPGVHTAAPPQTGTSCAWIMRATDRNDHSADIGELRGPPLTAPLDFIEYDRKWPLYQCSPKHVFTGIGAANDAQACGVPLVACQEDEMGEGCIVNPNYVQSQNYYGRTGQLPSTKSNKTDACLHTFPFPLPEVDYANGNVHFTFPDPTSDTQSTTSANFFTKQFCHDTCCAPLESLPPDQGWTVSGTRWTNFARNEIQAETCQSSTNIAFTNVSSAPLPPSYGTCLNCDGSSTQTDLAMTTFIKTATEARTLDATVNNGADAFRDYSAVAPPYTSDPSFPYIDVPGGSGWNCSFASDRVPQGFSYLPSGDTFDSTQLSPSAPGSAPPALWNRRPAVTFGTTTYEGDEGPTDSVAYPKMDSLPLRSCTSPIRVKMPHVWQRNSTTSESARYDVLDQSSAFWKSLDAAQRSNAEWGVVYPTKWEKKSVTDTSTVRSDPMGRGTFVGEWIRAGPHRALASMAPAATNGAWKPLELNARDYHPCDITDDGCVVGGSRKCHARSTSAAYIIVVEVLSTSSSALYIDNNKWEQSWPSSFYLPTDRLISWNGGGRFEICQATGSHDGQNELSDPHWFLPQNNKTYQSPWWAWNNGVRQWNFPIEQGFVVQGHRVTVEQQRQTFMDLHEFIYVTLPSDWNSATKHRIWPYIDVWWNVGGVAGGIRLRPHADCSLSVVSGSEPESSAYANRLLGLRTDGAEDVGGVGQSFSLQACDSAESNVARQKQQVDRDAKQTERWMSALRPWIYSRTSDGLSANPEPVLNYRCADDAMKVYTQLVSHRMRLRNLEAYLNELGVCTEPVNVNYIDYFVNPAYLARYEAEIIALETKENANVLIYENTVNLLLNVLNGSAFYGTTLDCLSTDRGKHQAACNRHACTNTPDFRNRQILTTCSAECGAGHYCCDEYGHNHQSIATEECPVNRDHLDRTIYIKNYDTNLCVSPILTQTGLLKIVYSHNCGVTDADKEKSKYVMIDAGGGTFYLKNAFTGQCLGPSQTPVTNGVELIHQDNGCRGDNNKFRWVDDYTTTSIKTDVRLQHVANSDMFLHTDDYIAKDQGKMVLYNGWGGTKNRFYTIDDKPLKTTYICHRPEYDLCVVKNWIKEDIDALVNCKFNTDIICTFLQNRIFEKISNTGTEPTSANTYFSQLLAILDQRKFLQQMISEREDRIVICGTNVCPIKQSDNDVLSGDIAYQNTYSKCIRSSGSRRLLDSSQVSSLNVLTRAVEGLRAHARANKQFSWSKTDSSHRELGAKRTARIAEQRSAIEEKRKHKLEIANSEPALAASTPRSCKPSSPGHGNKTRCLDHKEHRARERPSSQRRFGYSDITKALNLVNEVLDCFGVGAPDKVGLCFLNFAGTALTNLGKTISSGFLSAFEAAKNWMERRALEILEGARDTILALLRDIVGAITGAFGIDSRQAEKMRCEICNNKGILNVDLGDFDLSTCSVFMEESKKCDVNVHIFAKLFSPDFIMKVVDGTLDIAALIPALLASIMAFTERVINGGFLFPLLQLGGDLAFVVQFFLTSNHLMDTFRDLVQVFDDFEKNLSDGFTGKGASFNRAPYREKTTENINVAQEPGCTSGRNAAGQATGVASVGNTNCDKTNPQTCGCDVPPPPCTPNADGSGLTGTGCRYAAVVNGGTGKQATGCPADGLTPPVRNAETASFVRATVTTTTSQKQCTRRIRVPLSRNKTRVNELADAMGLPPIPGPFTGLGTASGSGPGNGSGTAHGGARRLFAAAHQWQAKVSSAKHRSGAFDAWSNLMGDWQRVHEGGARILRGAGSIPGVRWARAAASRVLLASVDNNDGCRASDDDPFKCCGATTYKSPYECCRGLTLCLTPLTSDRTDNLNWTKAQEWMRGDWKECIGLRHPGEIFLYALRRPLYGWDILDANDDASYPATTRTASGALQWLRFPDDRLPDNELLCFLFNLGAVAPWWFPLFIFGVISPVLIPYSIELLRLSVKCVLPDPNYALTS